MKHDVIVVGGGHAGCEAALAAARVGADVALVTLAADAIGRLSCNPAMGGIGKGHLAREVDALDGALGRVSDAAGIQFRLLNRSRGPAVRGPRAQLDRAVYAQTMQAEMAAVTVVEGEVADVMVTNGGVRGVTFADGRAIRAGAVVLTTGTFLGGVIHLGDQRWQAGRMGEAAAAALADRLSALKLPLGRLKTGTPPRLHAGSLRLADLEPQPGDADPVFLSATTDRTALPQRPCHITRTNPETHRIITDALHRSALYAGQIQGVGPRYCPSIEDKVVRFADREHHQIFLEPEGLDTPLIYPNGISNSLPKTVQLALVRSMEGCEAAEIVQPGYAIEYTFVDPRALGKDLQLEALPGLFLAGQINGTTGYEEAAAQGLLAGLNAARRAGGADTVTLGRDAAYIGVLVDDLTANGVDEPYRMFTSRAENRLTLRADNAGERLTDWGLAHGLVGPARAAWHAARTALKAEAAARLKALSLTPQEAARHGVTLNTDGKRRDGHALLALEAAGWRVVRELDGWFTTLPDDVAASLEADALYAAHKDRTVAAPSDAIALPAALTVDPPKGLSTELRAKLSARRPRTIGEARRISGMTAAGLALLAAHARRAGA